MKGRRGHPSAGAAAPLEDFDADAALPEGLRARRPGQSRSDNRDACWCHDREGSRGRRPLCGTVNGFPAMRHCHRATREVALPAATQGVARAARAQASGLR
ncbi:uncharacterized protein PO1_contig-017-39 [Mycobacterium sp. PO1]|nr:uncharacterized protein PO1_contig-017-39 [Mycobacterium sp. PO1]GFM23073.1 uncharacterized protein PO2_contig-022-36 [Mycobacterium sp. PO2]